MIAEADQGFYNKLSNWHSTYKTYRLIAPPRVSPPYVVYEFLDNRPTPVFGDVDSLENFNMMIHVWGTSPYNVVQCADLVINLMDGSSLTISGYTNILCLRDYVGSPIFDEVSETYQIPIRYRLINQS